MPAKRYQPFCFLLHYTSLCVKMSSIICITEIWTLYIFTHTFFFFFCVWKYNAPDLRAQNLEILVLLSCIWGPFFQLSFWKSDSIIPKKWSSQFYIVIKSSSPLVNSLNLHWRVISLSLAGFKDNPNFPWWVLHKMAVISFSDMHTIIAARLSTQAFGLPLL